jgi:hypothetical protein
MPETTEKPETTKIPETTKMSATTKMPEKTKMPETTEKPESVNKPTHKTVEEPKPNIVEVQEATPNTDGEKANGEEEITSGPFDHLK